MSEFEDEMDEKKLPSGINVLTILTLIGSGVFFFLSILGYCKNSENLAKMEEMANNPEIQKLPDFLKKSFSPEAIDLLRKVEANKIPLTVISIIGYLLCIYGAIEMRKLKKSGFYTYLIGELLPFFSVLIFIGTVYYGSAWSVLLGFGFPTLFIILYATQLKYLVNK